MVEEDLGVLEDGGRKLLACPPMVPVQQFDLQSGEKTLGYGVVQSVPHRSHQPQDVGLPESLPESQGGVLAIVVGVVNEARGGSAAGRGDRPDGHPGAGVRRARRTPGATTISDPPNGYALLSE